MVNLLAFFLFPVVGFVLFVSVIFGIVNRISFILKMQALCRVTNERTWRVWRLSAIEPVVTTILGFVWLFFVSDGLARDSSTYIVAQMSILLFVAWVWVVGEGCQRARLIIFTLFLRLLILSIPIIAPLLGVRPDYNDISFVDIATLASAFIARCLFGLYQNHVTPTSAQFIRQETVAQINLGQRKIEDGVTLLDDLDLWDEQVALIERLKAEKGAAEAQMVGRAQELM